MLVGREAPLHVDVPGKRWLEEQLAETRKTVLLISHDRELLSRAAQKIVAVEPSPAGSEVWVHGGGFDTFHEARRERFARFEELKRRWDEKHAQLKKLVSDMQHHAARSDALASLPRGADPAEEVRGGGATAGAAARAGHPHATARRADRNAGRDLREP